MHFRTIYPSYPRGERTGWQPPPLPLTSHHPLKPFLYYHESFVKLVPKFGIVTSLRTNFAAEADELCSPGNNSLHLLLQMQIITKIRERRIVGTRGGDNGYCCHSRVKRSSHIEEKIYKRSVKVASII